MLMGLLIGLTVGVFVGWFGASLCAISSRADERDYFERRERERQRDVHNHQG